jgi:hypothetical protein
MDDSPDARVAVATLQPEGGSWSGVRDSFGERATAVDAEGRPVDLLRLFPAFTPSSRAIAGRIALLGVDRPAVGRAVALERDDPSARLILISEHVPGVRLSELLRTAGERSIVADLGAALFVMRRLLTLAESLKAATGLADFSIAPERIVITPHGRVVMVEPVLAAAAGTGATASNDIAAIAIAGMSMMLGHLIEDAQHVDPLSPVLQDAADVAAIRAGNSFSNALRLWFDRAVIADPTLSFPDFRHARLALSRVLLTRESGCDASRRALKVFLRKVAIERLTDVEAAALESERLREIRAKRLARRKAIFAPDEEWISVEEELLIGDESRVVAEQFQGGVVDLDEPADEAIGIGPPAESGMAAAGEESLEAALVEEPFAAALVEWPIEAGPVEEPTEAALVEEKRIESAPSEELFDAALVEESTEADAAPSAGSWFRSVARQLGLASAQPETIETDLAAPAEDAPFESLPPELSIETIADPAATDTEIVAEFSTGWAEPVPGEARTESGDAGEAGRPEVDDQLIEIDHAEPPVEIEERFTGEAEPVGVDALDPSLPMEPAIEAQAEPPAEAAQEPTAFAAEAYESAPIDAESDAEPGTLEQPARSLAEPVAAESWGAWTGRISEESIAPRADDGPADAVQEEPTRVVGAELPFETIDAPLEEDEPVAPVDESIAAKLAEDAHKSWIQSITDQVGRMRRREEDLREPPAETTADGWDGTPLVDQTETRSPGEESPGTVDEFEMQFGEDAADPPAIEAAPIQLEWEDRTEQPGAWATPEPAPRRDDARAAGTAMPIPAESVEEFLRAALVEPTEAPAPSRRSWFRSVARRLGLGSTEPQPLETELAASPENVALETPSAEQSIETIADPAADIEIVAEFSTDWAEPVPDEARTESEDSGEEGWAEESAIEAQGEHPAEVQEPTAFTAEAAYESAPTDTEFDTEPEAFEQPATSLANPAAESLSAWTKRMSQEAIAPRVDDGDAPPADAIEEEPARIVGEEVPFETIDAPLEEDEPVAPVDGSVAAALAEDAHKSWIQSITDQVGRMRRREEDLREPPAEITAGGRDGAPPVDHLDHMEAESPGELSRTTVDEFEAQFDEDAADPPAVESAPVQLERAAMPHVEARSEQPTAWATPVPAPRRDDARPAGTVVPFPAEPVDHEYAPHRGVLQERVADAQPHRPDAQPVRRAPSSRTIMVPLRRWARAAATILVAGLALAIVAALVIAGRSYYKRISTPGTVVVDSTPRGSEVLVDGTARGVTPLTLTLEPGDHVLALRRNGITRQFPIDVTPGAQLSRQLDWSTVRATGTLAISSTPSKARVTVDGKERGVTPLTVADLPVGMRRIVIESSAGTVRREVRVVADSLVTINETIISGWIAAFAPFELQIYEGTRLLGTTEDGRIMAPPGPHELDFVNTRLGFRERRVIEVNPGATTAVNITTAVGIVQITAPAGADVLVDGVLFGATPLRELRLPIGLHEIVLRHPELGEQRVSITVGASAPTEVVIDFPKP